VLQHNEASFWTTAIVNIEYNNNASHNIESNDNNHNDHTVYSTFNGPDEAHWVTCDEDTVGSGPHIEPSSTSKSR
jgi:hypothetical protein